MISDRQCHKHATRRKFRESVETKQTDRPDSVTANNRYDSHSSSCAIASIVLLSTRMLHHLHDAPRAASKHAYLKLLPVEVTAFHPVIK